MNTSYREKSEELTIWFGYAKCLSTSGVMATVFWIQETEAKKARRPRLIMANDVCDDEGRDEEANLRLLTRHST